MSGIRHLFALGLTGIAAAACTAPPLTNDARHLHDVEKQFPIVVEPQVVTLAVQVDGDMGDLARGEDGRIAAFAQRWKARGQGMLTVATAGPGNDGAVGQLKKLLSANGVDRKSVQFTTYPPASGEAHPPIALSFVTYAAMATECGQDWSKNLAFEPRNSLWPEYGCSTQNNLAAMIADPRDLIEPHASAPSDALRRSIVIEKYQKGEATAAAGNGDADSGQSSQVAPSSGAN